MKSYVDVHPTHRTAVVEVEDLLLDLESMLQAETYSELKQCVSDYIDELKEK